jgi:hypothetical protein
MPVCYFLYIAKALAGKFISRIKIHQAYFLNITHNLFHLPPENLGSRFNVQGYFFVLFKKFYLT